MPATIGPRQLRQRAILDAVEHSSETFYVSRFGTTFAVLMPDAEYKRLTRQVRELAAAVAATPGGVAFLEEWRRRWEECR